MKTEILLIRHGEVENPENIEYMRLPGFGLSYKGASQIKALAEKLKKYKIDLIYSSPLQRAKETAEILSKNISNKKIKIKLSEELIEANYWKWEGLKRNERDKAELNGYWKDPVKYSSILGESLEDIQKRVVEKILEIAKNNKGKRIIITSHADPIITARLYFENLPLKNFWDFEARHASVTSIIFNNELRCESINYYEYLKTDGSRKK